MSIHKARIADPSQWPPELCCCEIGTNIYKQIAPDGAPFTVDISTAVKKAVCCNFCGIIKQLTMVYHPNPEIAMVALEELDIDEAPCPPSD